MASIGPRSSTPATPLLLHTLGGVSLRTAGGEEVLGPGKPLALLVYLACDARGMASRTHLLDLFWSDTEPERARHALRQVIWYLRQVLGAEVLRTSNADLVLDAPVMVDRDRLLEAVGRGDCDEAVRLYTGDFLGEFAVPGGAGFEHWADVERQRLRAAFQRSAEQAVRRHLDAGRFLEAQALARRSRDSAPADESGWRLYLETLHITGDRVRSAMEAAALLRELGQEGRTPEAATRAVLAAIAREAETVDETGSNALIAELVGREQQFAQCLSSWNRVGQTDVGQHLHILAPAGYGKSRLMHDVRVRLHSIGVRCVTVRATPGQRDISYSCAGDLAGALATLPGASGVSPATATILVSLNPSLSSRYPFAGGGTGGDDALHRRSSAIAELCAVVAEEGPFALLVDDLHWADSASRQIIRTLLERIEQFPCLAITSARPGPEQVTFGDATRTTSLPPLSVEHVTRLLSSLGTLPDEGWSIELPALLCKSTLGSPLLILESLRLMLDRGDLRLHQGEWSCARPRELQAHLTDGRALRHRHDQLGGAEREMLLLLASAGEEVQATLLAHASNLALGVVLERLGALEQKGFVERAGDRWQVLHDEIARESLLAATPEEQRRSHMRLGSALAAGAVRRGDYIRAARNFYLADGRRELRQVVIGYAQLSRREGDSRRMRYLARDLLPDVDDPTIVEILQSLGRWNRLRYTSVRPVMFSGGAIAALLLASVALRNPPDVPVDVELVVAPEDSLLPTYQVPLRVAQFLSAERLNATTGERAAIPVPRGGASLVYTVGADCLYYVRPSGTETTSDIYRRCVGKPPELVYAAPRDDGYPAPSPDGRRMALTTSQWSRVGADNYDLALLDLETHQLEPLVRSDSFMEIGSNWSPDGARIAYVRRLGNVMHLCFVAPVRLAPVRCAPGTLTLGDILGWVTSDQLLTGHAGQRGMTIIRHTISTGRRDTLLQDALIRPVLSQDGRWFATTTLVPGRSQPAWFLYRTEAPDDPRLIELPGDAEEYRVLAVTRERYSHMIDSLAITPVPEPLAPGVAYQLQLTAFNRAGEEIELTAPVQWSVSPAANAIVDSAGRLVPVQGAGVEVSAELPGWAEARSQVTFRPQPAELLLDERWHEGLTRRWIPYGDPRSRLVDGPDGPAFLNNGDGSYPSGAYLRDGYSLSHGLAVEAEIRAPLTRTQWQSISIEWCGGCDSATMGAWDHSSGPPAYDGARRQVRTCSATFPSTEGPGTGDSLTFGTRNLVWAVPDFTRTMKSGRPHRLLLQLFADGRCGVALDGVGLAVSRVAVKRDRPFHLLLNGNSAGTRILVGPVRAWRGVREGTDWSRAEQ